MTERKPPGVSFETWVEKQIREAMDRGEFDNLPGAGKPIPNLHDADELWWVKGKLRREGVSGEAMLPTGAGRSRSCRGPSAGCAPSRRCGTWSPTSTGGSGTGCWCRSVRR